MSLKNFKEILMKLPDVEAWTLTGGDPFTVSDLPGYCDACISTCNVKPTIFTTGFINHSLIPKLAGKVKKIHVNIKYPLPLDDIWKGKNGAFEQALAFLGLCKVNSISTYINWTVDKTNLLYLTDMLNIAVEYKTRLLALPFIPYDLKYERNRIPYKFYCSYFEKVSTLNPLLEMGVECDICKAGVTRLNINVRGETSPCIYLPHIRFGNILEDDLDEIIEKMQGWREEKGLCGCIAQDIDKIR